MIRVCRILAIMLAGLLATTGAAAGTVWWNDTYSVTRFESANGHLHSISLPSAVLAVVPLADDGAWLVHAGLLLRLQSDLKTSVVVPLVSPTPAERLVAIADDDGGIWIAQGAVMLHFDGAGQLLGQWTHAGPVNALATMGRRGIVVGDASGIHHYAASGALARSVFLSNAGTPSELMLDRAGGYLWVTSARSAVQLDVLTGFAERSRIDLSGPPAAAALDPVSGQLWLLSDAALVAIERDATRTWTWTIPVGTLSAPSALAVDGPARRFWVGDHRGTIAFNLEAAQWIRLVEGRPTTYIAEMHPRVAPRIALETVVPGVATTLRLHLGALCGDLPCSATPRYLDHLELSASFAGVDIVNRLKVDRDAGMVEVSGLEPWSNEAAPLRLSVSDSYGTSSATIFVDPSTLAGNGLDTKRKANALPTVNITAPANNATLVAPANMTIAATASDSDGTIARVEFYRGTVLLGTDAVAPFSVAWNSVGTGTYMLTAKAYDNSGGTTTSPVVTVQVNANAAPTVALTAPANNSAYTAPATINLAANAADRDGTITKVEFYSGATRIATALTAPYRFTWNNVAGGTYSLTARATDDKGAITTSAGVAVKVNKVPTVALSAPANNTVLQAPVNVTISATASDSDGSVAKVEFLRDGVLLGSDTSSPYSFSWTNVPVGTYVLTARATDNLGATTLSSARTLKVNANLAPTVALTLPVDGSAVIAGVPMTIAANASDPDGAISKVEFYASTATGGSAMLGTDAASPYSISTRLDVGLNTLTAVATDNRGIRTTSAPINVSVVANQLPAVSLVSPTPGRAYPSLAPPDITITANASDADGRIVSVKFHYLPDPTVLDPEPVPVLIGAVTTPPYQAIWHGVPLTGTGLCEVDACSPAGYLITVEATDDAGGVATDTAYITVPNQSPWTIRIVAPNNQPIPVFNAPATIVVAAIAASQASDGDPVVKVEFMADGSVLGTVAGAPNGSGGEYVHVWRGLGAGTRTLVVRLHDAAGFSVDSDPITVRVRNPTLPPVVMITTPAHGQAYLPSASLGMTSASITAVASDIDGAVTSIGIVVDDAAAFSAAGSTLDATWDGIPEGVHVISANAVDDAAARTQSRPVYIQSLASPRLQAIALTSPAPGTVTSPVVLAAEVGAPEGGVDRVEFFEGSTLLGAVAKPPYRLQISPGNGTHVFSAAVVAYNHLRLASTPVTVAVGGSNARPGVSLTAPGTGQVFSLGTPVPLAANASDADGTIAKVEFYANAAMVATTTTAPHAATWIPAAAGTYSITAKATDNQLGTSTSAPVSIAVSSNTPPQVTLTSPPVGQTYFAGVPFAIAANAADPGGAVAKVEFFAGTALIGQATSAPFAISWSAPAAGTYVLTARATDNSNAVATSAGISVTIATNAIPTIALTMPRTGQAFVTGGTIDLVAVAGDGEGAIARVEFYAGATLLGSATTGPFAHSWKSVATGDYVVTARVVDARGATTTSAPVAVVVRPLALTVTSPAANASTAADTVTVAGAFTAPGNSGVTVNGTVAATDGLGQFFVSNLPLDSGANTIEITLTTMAGQTVSQTITVTSTGDSPFQVVATPDEGVAPLQVSLRYSARAGNVISFHVDNLGSGVLDTSQFGPGMLGVMTFTNPGIYQPRATIVYDGGATYTQSFTVVVRDVKVMDQGFLSLLSDFVGALRSGNNALALQHLSGPLQVQFAPVFDALRPSMTQVIDTFKGFGAVSIDGDIATYAAKRQADGKTRIFLIDFLRDFDGVWRIDSM